MMWSACKKKFSLQMTKKVVVDLDAGTDDAVALLLLLTLEHEKDYKVVGITCTHGNTAVDNVCRNVLTTLQCINRLDVPVFRGAEGPLISVEDPKVVFTYFHGKNGFGDKEFPLSGGSIQPENAITALTRIAAESKGISLICLGPLTNVALALRTYPELSKNLKEIYIMGGNVSAVGNTSATGEFNFLKDPEAAHIVLSSLSCPVTILPWESTLGCSFTMVERFKTIASIPSPQIRLLNEIEKEVHKNEAMYNCCDALLAAAFIEKTVTEKFRNVHFTVELHGFHTRGQGVVDHQRKKEPNVKVLDQLNVETFKKLYLKMAAYKPRTHPQPS